MSQLAHEPQVFAGAAPGIGSRFSPSGWNILLGRLVSIVKKLIERHFQGACQFFQRFDGRDGMAVLDAREVAAQQAGSFLDITLGEFFFFAQ